MRIPDLPMVSDEPRPPNSTQPGSAQPCPATGGVARPRIIDSAELLQGRREVWIEHGGEMYRLRLTSSGKLYLTK
jgi:hemin uptake protein HemP